MTENLQKLPEPLFVGDNLALDFINTQYGVGSAHCEYFVDDKSVLGWLKQAKILPGNVQDAPQGLQKLALELRESAKALVYAAKVKNDADTRVVNRVLELGQSSRELEWDSTSGLFKITTKRRVDNSNSLLEPVAQAVVELLTDTQLELVRQCEAHDCTLMFHDKTKAHRRRWCSMALCGNRMKVAAFRLRRKTETIP